MRQAVRLNDRMPEAHYLLALCLREQGQMPAAQKALTLKDRHKFKTEMDQEALHAMFPHLKEKVA
jgi:uncharacterized protein YaiI (UPF0178 family)